MNPKTGENEHCRLSRLHGGKHESEKSRSRPNARHSRHSRHACGHRKGFGVFGRPGFELAPLIQAGLKEPRFGKLAIAAALQVEQEEGKLDAFTIVGASLRSEVDIAQTVAIAARETAVVPRMPSQFQTSITKGIPPIR